MHLLSGVFCNQNRGYPFLQPRDDVFEKTVFFKPQGEFKVFLIGQAEYIDPVSYDRYNLPAEIFVSFDPQEVVRIYKGLKPLFQEAYKDLVNMAVRLAQ